MDFKFINDRREMLAVLPTKQCQMLGVEWARLASPDKFKKEVDLIDNFFFDHSNFDYDLLAKAIFDIAPPLRNVLDILNEGYWLNVSHFAFVVATCYELSWSRIIENYQDALPPTFNDSWLTTDVTLLSQQIVFKRDFSLMPILADALQDAGCDNEKLLDRYRHGGNFTRAEWLLCKSTKII